MAVINAKLLCLCLVAVAATVAAHEVQTLPGKGVKGHYGVQTLPGHLGGGFPPRTPQVQTRPGKFNGRYGNSLKPVVRPGRPSNHPLPVHQYSGPLTKPRPRPSKGGDRFRRSYAHDSDESDERRYRRQVVDEEDEYDEDYPYSYDEEV